MHNQTGTEAMIPLTRLNGDKVAINPDRIERADITPDLVLTMTDGSKFVIAESLDELIDRIRLFRASVLALSHRLVFEDEDDEAGGSRLRVVRGATTGAVVDRHEVYDHAPPGTARPVNLHAVEGVATDVGRDAHTEPTAPMAPGLEGR